MSWHFQVVRDKDGLLGIHEVYKDANGQVWGWTAAETMSGFDDIEDLRGTLKLMLRDAERPVVDEADLPHDKEEV